jgi:hypothetical protein
VTTRPTLNRDANVLKVEHDTSHGNYTGDQVGEWMKDAVEKAIAGGYVAVDFKWWDVFDGWVTSRITWRKP